MGTFDKLVLLDSLAGKMSAHAWRNVLMVSWPQRSDVAGVRLLTEVRSRYLPRHPEGVSLIHITAVAGMPQGETSKAWVDMMKRHSEHVRCIAVVVLAHGFGASAVHSWVTEKRMIEAPGQFKMRLHSSVEDLMAWLPAEHKQATGVLLDEPLLLQHLRHLADAMRAPEAVRASEAR